MADGCDLCPDDTDNDAEDDGFCADEDNCPLIPNPAQTDTGGGGGGGGGSVGRIRVRAGLQCSLAGSVSPAASTSCP